MELSLVLLSVLCLVHSSLQQQEPPFAKKVIHDVRNFSEDKMKEALGPSSGFEVTKYAVSDLNDLEEAAIEDLDDIEAFKGDGDKVNAVSNSLIFWIDKMNSTIRPFVERPQDYEGHQIDHIAMPDLTKNTTYAYKKIEKDIEETIKRAKSALQEELDKFASVKATSLDDVTNTTWRRLKAKQAHRRNQEDLDAVAFYAKESAARGVDGEDYHLKAKFFIDQFKETVNDPKTFSN